MIRSTITESISRIEKNEWEGRFPLPFFMQYDPLRAVEESHVNALKTMYCRFSNGSDLGRANLYIVDTDLSTFDEKLKNVRKTIKHWYPGFLNLRTIECGLFTAIGEGLVIADESNRESVLRTLAGEMDTIGLENDTDLQMIRDVPLKEYRLYRTVLKEFGYYPVPGFPDTEIPVPYENLDDYLSRFKRHKRKNLYHDFRAVTENSGVTIEFRSGYGDLAGRMAELWKNVSCASASYQRELLDEAYFTRMAACLDGRSEVLLFSKDGKIITFFLSLFDDDNYYIENYGTDYADSDMDGLNLYKAGVLLSIERAIAMKKKKVSLGITTYFPKLSLGAEIRPLIYFVKHSRDRDYSKALAKMFYDDIRQPDLSVHHPFKDRVSNRINLQRLSIKIRKDQYDLPDNDIFLKVSKYHRMNSMRLARIYNLYPEFRCAQQSSVTMKDSDRIVLLGTNSYLGAANFPSVKQAAKDAIDRYGSGCSGSPLLNGTLDLHNELEHRLAGFFGREAVVLCSTGYQTNLAGISALAEPGDIIVMDERSHRSLFDGARLSGASYYIYKHNDMAHLEWVLSRIKNRKKIVVTDSVFSMEGVIADVASVCALARCYNARTFIDESHAVGVFGDHGRGVCEAAGVEADVDIIMGTFSKSFASIGGFLAGKRDVIDFIKHTGAPHIFSASLPPASIATVLAVLKVIEDEPGMRADILRKAEYMANGLSEMGYNARFRGTQIVPVIFGNEVLSMAAYKKYMEDGVYVNPILPPAVPESDSGFRTSYMAGHKWEDLEYALEIFRKNRKDFIG